MSQAFRVPSLLCSRRDIRIKLPAEHLEAQVMVRELQDFETKIDPDGDAKFGSHDDYVNALGLAVLVDPAGAGFSTA